MSELLTAIKKRDVLYGAKKATAEERKTLAQQFEAAGWLNDAADFAHQAHDTQTLERLRQSAREEGNVFLFVKCSLFLGVTDLSQDEGLLSCARKAEELGKFRFAIKGYDRLGREDDSERLRESLAEDGDIRAEREAKVFIPENTEEVSSGDSDA